MLKECIAVISNDIYLSFVVIYIYIYIYICMCVIYNIFNICIPAHGLSGRVFANGPGDQGSFLGRVIPKTQEVVLDISLLNTQHYKVCFKGKCGAIQGKEERLPLHLGFVAIEKGSFG